MHSPSLKGRFVKHAFRYFYLALVPLGLGLIDTLFQALFLSSGGGDFITNLTQSPVVMFASVQPLIFGSLTACLSAIAVAGYFFDRREQDTLLIDESSPALTLTRVELLRSETLQLGDKGAATFPYVAEPIAALYAHAKDLLAAANAGLPDACKGILILGSANAGKTRLALEAMRATLSGWYVLVWRPEDQLPTTQHLGDKRVVIFIDDLQEHVPPEIRDQGGRAQALDSKQAALKTMLANVRGAAREAIVIVTCRSEDEVRAIARFSWLFAELEMVRIPHFQPKDPKLEPIVALFAQRGAKHTQEWDGTLGSLVLGLIAKKAQYQQLVLNRDVAFIVLQAMKLLMLAGVYLHTIERVRACCISVFARDQLSQDSIWDETLDRLTQFEFVTEEADDISGKPYLLIRKDVYFERVIDDYPPPYRPLQLDHDLHRLQETLVNLGDADALFALGNTLYILQADEGLVAVPTTAHERAQHDAALEAYASVVAINPRFAEAWRNRADLLRSMHRYDDAMASVERALEIDQSLTYAWRSKGDILRGMQRFPEALAAYDQALNRDNHYGLAWIGRGRVLVDMGHFDDALLAFDQAIAIAIPSPTAYVYRNKADTLRSLGRYAEALAAHDAALAIDDRYAYAWNGRGNVLSDLERFDEAIVSYQRALDLLPAFVQAQQGLERAQHQRAARKDHRLG